jgi:hypothetical protein
MLAQIAHAPVIGCCGFVPFFRGNHCQVVPCDCGDKYCNRLAMEFFGTAIAPRISISGRYVLAANVFLIQHQHNIGFLITFRLTETCRLKVEKEQALSSVS